MADFHGNKLFVNYAKLLLAVALLALSSPGSASAQVRAAQDETPARLRLAMKHLARFESSQSLNDLEKSVQSAYSASDFTRIRAEDRVARRREVVTVYAKIIHYIDAIRDPEFNPNSLSNRPARCLVPDREPSGRQLPSCADPKDITDAATRERYIAATNQNDQKLRQPNIQVRIMQIDSEASQDLSYVLSRFRQSTIEDGSGITSILRREGLSENRQAQIKQQM